METLERPCEKICPRDLESRKYTREECKFITKYPSAEQQLHANTCVLKCRLGDTNRGWTQRRPFWNVNITKVERPLSMRKNMVSNISELKSERDFHGKIS